MAASYPTSVKSFSTKTDGSTVIMAAHVNDLQLEVSAIETDLLTAPVDYSTSSTIVGWSSFTTKELHYRPIAGKLYLVWFHFAGTSNSTDLTFTLPWNAKTGEGTQGCAIPGTNNGGSVSNGLIKVPAGSNVVTAYSTMSGATWTGVGTKEILGQFLVQAE